MAYKITTVLLAVAIILCNAYPPPEHDQSSRRPHKLEPVFELSSTVSSHNRLGIFPPGPLEPVSAFNIMGPVDHGSENKHEGPKDNRGTHWSHGMGPSVPDHSKEHGEHNHHGNHHRDDEGFHGMNDFRRFGGPNGDAYNLGEFGLGGQNDGGLELHRRHRHNTFSSGSREQNLFRSNEHYHGDFAPDSRNQKGLSQNGHNQVRFGPGSHNHPYFMRKQNPNEPSNYQASQNLHGVRPFVPDQNKEHGSHHYVGSHNHIGREGFHALSGFSSDERSDERIDQNLSPRDSLERFDLPGNDRDRFGPDRNHVGTNHRNFESGRHTGYVEHDSFNRQDHRSFRTNEGSPNNLNQGRTGLHFGPGSFHGHRESNQGSFGPGGNSNNGMGFRPKNGNSEPSQRHPSQGRFGQNGHTQGGYRQGIQQAHL